MGDEVKKGDVLLSLEARKMETSVYADRDGRVAEVFVKSGDQVDAKDCCSSSKTDQTPESTRESAATEPYARTSSGSFTRQP